MIGAMTPILLAHVLRGNAILVAWQNVVPSQTLCYPAVVAPIGLNLYRVAYERVQDRQYAAAARVYYPLRSSQLQKGTIGTASTLRLVSPSASRPTARED